MQQPSLLDIITFVGVVLSFIVGAAGLWIGIKNTQKTIFINAVTTSRIQYIQDLRNSIAEFCGLLYRYTALAKKNLICVEKPEEATQKAEMLKEADRLKYLILLYLNPLDIEWDEKIKNLIDDIIKSIQENPHGSIDNKTNELITITQFLLKLEWEGAKLESQKGIVSKKEKKKLYRKHVKLYENYIQKSSSK